MQNAAKISPTKDETERGRNDHKAMQLPEKYKENFDVSSKGPLSAS